jgi:hypothetical protein
MDLMLVSRRISCCPEKRKKQIFLKVAEASRRAFLAGDQLLMTSLLTMRLVVIKTGLGSQKPKTMFGKKNVFNFGGQAPPGGTLCSYKLLILVGKPGMIVICALAQ